MDTLGWRRDVEEARNAGRAAFRMQHGLVGTVILFVGQLTRAKGIPELLAALNALAADLSLPPWSALFVGSGPLAAEIDAWATSHPTVPVVSTGFVQPQGLAKYYAVADVFVMPSLFDPWGLVCLEALVARIPQVTSLFAGAAADLVTASEIGVVMDPRDARILSNHLADRIRAGRQLVPEELSDHAMTMWSSGLMVERALSSIRAVLQNESRAGAS